MNNEYNNFGNQMPNNNSNIPESPMPQPDPVVQIAPEPQVQVAPVEPVQVAPVAPAPQAQPTMPEPQMNANNYGQPMNEEPKKNKTIFIVIGVVVAALIGLAVYFIPKMINDKKIDNLIEDIEKDLEKESQELSKHYAIKEYKLADGDILVEVENKNKVPVYASVKMVFYDDNNNLVDTQETFITGIYASKKSYGVINASNTKYARYETTVKLSALSFTKLYEDKVTVTPTMSEELLLSITNTTNETIEECDVGVIYYDKDDNIIGYGKVYVDPIGPNETVVEKSYIPYDANLETIAYSRYEVVVNAAYTYEY